MSVLLKACNYNSICTFTRIWEYFIDVSILYLKIFELLKLNKLMQKHIQEHL